MSKPEFQCQLEYLNFAKCKKSAVNKTMLKGISTAEKKKIVPATAVIFPDKIHFKLISGKKIPMTDVENTTVKKAKSGKEDSNVVSLIVESSIKDIEYFAVTMRFNTKEASEGVLKQYTKAKKAKNEKDDSKKDQTSGQEDKNQSRSESHSTINKDDDEGKIDDNSESLSSSKHSNVERQNSNSESVTRPLSKKAPRKAVPDQLKKVSPSRSPSISSSSTISGHHSPKRSFSSSSASSITHKLDKTSAFITPFFSTDVWGKSQRNPCLIKSHPVIERETSKSPYIKVSGRPSSRSKPLTQIRQNGAFKGAVKKPNRQIYMYSSQQKPRSRSSSSSSSSSNSSGIISTSTTTSISDDFPLRNGKTNALVVRRFPKLSDSVTSEASTTVDLQYAMSSRNVRPSRSKSRLNVWSCYVPSGCSVTFKETIVIRRKSHYSK